MHPPDSSPDTLSPASTADTPPPLPDAARPGHAVYGAWATVGLGALGVLLFLGVAIAVVVVIVAITFALHDGPLDHEALGHSAHVLSIAGVLSCAIGLAYTLFIIKLKRGASIAAYLGLRRPRPATLLKLSLATVALIGASDLTFYLLGLDVVDPGMVRTVQGAGLWWPLLLFALVVCAPVFEEAFFRGFLIQGLYRSRLGVAGALVLTSLVWTSLHATYQVHALIVIFIAGILLGLVWLKTRCLWYTIYLHALMNLIATIETVVVAARQGL